MWDIEVQLIKVTPLAVTSLGGPPVPGFGLPTCITVSGFERQILQNRRLFPTTSVVCECLLEDISYPIAWSRALDVIPCLCSVAWVLALLSDSIGCILALTTLTSPVFCPCYLLFHASLGCTLFLLHTFVDLKLVLLQDRCQRWWYSLVSPPI